LTDHDGNVIGHVTSGTMSPILNKGIGMAYVNKAYSAFGTEVFMNVRNKQLKAKIVKLPFINPI
jgi:aminomethyltransferase